MMSGPTPELPPNPPPLPPNRTGLLQRITAPFNLGTRVQEPSLTQSSNIDARGTSSTTKYNQLPSQTTVHRTGIPLAAVDLNKDKSLAILAGQEILKTIRIQDGRAVEDFNLRSAINVSAAYGPKPDAANHRREYLPAKDVRWSHGPRYDHIIATAAVNGRIALYDVGRLGGSRIELEWIHHHTGQVNKLDFDPFEGYLLLSGSQDKTVKIWDIRNPTVLKKQNFNMRHPVRDIKWSPTDVGEFALCTENGIVQRWDLRNPTQALLSINAHEKACYTIDWHPDGRHLASGGFDKYVRIWDFKSENRRQKPALQLKTPQAIMNLRWRPPCWSSELTQSGLWQCTQLATGYTDDDPRLHVWDLRRPLIPFREFDRHNSRPTDLLWASQDLLWSVGNEGMFVQTDVRYAHQVHDQVSPCALQFSVDGNLLTFTEDMRRGLDFSHDDPAARFLRIPVERLSGVTDDATSRAASDDDLDEDFSTTSSRKHPSKTTSSRSIKSQSNTPPNFDVPPLVTSLDRSVLNRTDLFVNEQSGTLSTINGISDDPYVVEFLATNYARPSDVDERKQEPSKILQRLKEAFMHNAKICDYVALHRTAQSWRILCAVVIPELKDWADRNRSERLAVEAKRLSSVEMLSGKINGKSPRNQGIDHRKDTRLSQKPSKVVNNLFKGVVASEIIGHESESSSNMTTPLAVPLPDSPHSRQGEHYYLKLNEITDPMPPLPPSVVNSHATAAAASRALVHDDSDQIESSQPSPERQRSQLQYSNDAKGPVNQFSGLIGRGNQPHTNSKAGSSSIASHSPKGLRSQEDRRAAIRDYRAQTRPVFTLEAPIQSSRYENVSRHDSADSFSMFPASTESSSKLQAMVDSSVSSDAQIIGGYNSEDWQLLQDRASFDSTPPSGEAGQPQYPHHLLADSGNKKGSLEIMIDDPPGFSFGADGRSSNRPQVRKKISSAANIWDMQDMQPIGDDQGFMTTASSASEGVFHFEQIQSAPKLKIYSSNPLRRMASQTQTDTLRKLKEQDLDVKDMDLSSREYVYSDFRPLQFTNYEPRLPFAWSALPLVCHAIAFDIVEGPGCAQFAVHVLMHLHPFLFNQAFREPLISPSPTPDVLAERLMRPDLSHRIIEGLLLNHINFLQNLYLYEPRAVLKNMCVEFDYPAISQSSRPEQTMGTSLLQDPYTIQISCAVCCIILPNEATFCTNCQQTREVCPICLALDQPATADVLQTQNATHGFVKLWALCQKCGHGAHYSCMHEWSLLTDTEGVCPSLGCGCDCGPGEIREQRLKRQIVDTDNSEIIRGSRAGSSATRRDPIRVVPSPAVDRVRDTLRYADLVERGTRSGDETGQRSPGSRSTRDNRMGASGNGSRSRDGLGSRRVRLVAPGEQSGMPV